MGNGGQEDVSTRPAGPSARYRRERGAVAEVVSGRAPAVCGPWHRRAGGSGLQVAAEAADPVMRGEFGGEGNERKPAKG